MDSLLPSLRNLPCSEQAEALINQLVDGVVSGFPGNILTQCAIVRGFQYQIPPYASVQSLLRDIRVNLSGYHRE